MSGTHTIENTNFTSPPPTNEELLKRIKELETQVKELYKVIEPLKQPFYILHAPYFSNCIQKEKPSEKEVSLKEYLTPSREKSADLEQSNSDELEALRKENKS